jgi:hypothetical protein
MIKGIRSGVDACFGVVEIERMPASGGLLLVLHSVGTSIYTYSSALYTVPQRA